MAYQQDSRRDAVSPGGDMRSEHRNDRRTGPEAYSMGSETRRSRGEPGHRDIENARDDSRSAAIERDIDRTRSRMDETVETLADRLRPSSIISDVLDYFASDEGVRTDAEQRQKVKRVARRAGRGTWETVKSNPMASALIAGGVAWMFLKRGDEENVYYTSRERMAGRSAEPMMYGGSYVDARTGRPYDVDRYGEEPERGHAGRDTGGRMREYAQDAAEGARSAAGWVADKASEAAGAVRRTAGEAAESLGDTASDIGDRSRGAMESGRRAMGHYAEDLRHRAHDMGDWSRHRAEDMAEWSRRQADASWRRAQAGLGWSRERFDDGMRDYPLAMGVAALAAGVLAGLAVPRTRREDRMFGAYSHELKDRVGDVGSEAWNRAREAAREEGLDPDSLRHQARDLASRASEAASRVAETAVESAREVVGDVSQAARSEARELREEAGDSGFTPGSLKQKAGHIASEAARGAREETEHQVEDADRKHGISGSGGTSTGNSGMPGTTTSTAFTMPDQGKAGGS